MAVLFYSAVDDPVQWTESLHAVDPALDIRIWPEAGDLADIDVALAWLPEPGLLARCPNLKLIQSIGAGTDHIVADRLLPAGVPVTRLVDAALTSQMVEYVLLAVLSHHRRLAEYRAFQARSEWRQLPACDTGRARVGVMGLGVIGGAVARALADLGFPVAGWSRSQKSHPGIEAFHGAEALIPFLAQSDILICLLPLTAETEGILNAAAFAAMPEGAYVVNAARGGHVHEADLLASLDRGHLSGAWLDVCRIEPLPSESPLWRHPKVTLTPHIAGLVLPQSAAAQVVENIRRVRAGEAPLNIVDPRKGY